MFKSTYSWLTVFGTLMVNNVLIKDMQMQNQLVSQRANENISRVIEWFATRWIDSRFI